MASSGSEFGSSPQAEVDDVEDAPSTFTFPKTILSRHDALMNKELVDQNLDKCRKLQAEVGGSIGLTDAAQENGFPTSHHDQVLEMQELMKRNTELADQVSVKQERISKILQDVSTYSEAELKRLVSLRDKYPGMGATLVRMIPYFSLDFDEMLESFPGLKSFVTADMEFRFGSLASAPAPSQDVGAWKTKLAEAEKAKEEQLAQVKAHLEQATDQTKRYRSKLGQTMTTLETAQASVARGKVKWTEREAEFTDKFGKLKTSRDDFRKRLDEMQREYNVVADLSRRYREERDGARSSLHDAKTDLEAAKDRTEELKKTVSSLGSASSGSGTVINGLRSTVRNLQAQINTAEEDCQTAVEAVRTTAGAIETELKGEIGSLRKDKRLLQVDLSARNDRVEFLQTRVNQAEETEKEVQDEKTNLWAKIEELNRQVRELKAKNAKQATEHNSTMIQQQQCTVAREKLSFSLKLTTHKYEAVKEQLAETRAQVVEDLKQGGADKKAELDSLQNMVTHHKAKCEEFKTERNDFKARWMEGNRIEEKLLDERSNAFQQRDTAVEQRNIAVDERNQLIQERDETQASLTRAQADLTAARGKLQFAEEKRQEAVEQRDKAAKNHARSLEIEQSETKSANASLNSEKILTKTLQDRLSVARHATLSNNELVNGLRDDLEKEQDKVEELQASLNLEKDQGRKLQAGLDAQAREVVSLQVALGDEQKRLESLQTALETEMRTVQAELGTKTKETEGIRTALETEMETVQRLQAELGTKTKEAEGLQTALDTKTKEAEGTRTALETEIGTVQRLQTALDTKTKEAEGIRTALETEMGTVQRLQAELGTKTKEAESLQTALETEMETVQCLQTDLGVEFQQAKRIQSALNTKTKEALNLQANLETESQKGESKKKALVQFLSELFTCTLDDCGDLINEIHQYGVRDVVLKPVKLECWTLLNSWTDSQAALSKSPDVPPSGGLTTLIMDVFRAMASNQLGSWQCQASLRSLTRAVLECEQTVVHGQIFVVLADLLIKTASRLQPSFEAALAFWQIMHVVDQRWQSPPSWDDEKMALESFLKGHVYSEVFRVVNGTGQLVESRDCHFFTATVAVIIKPAENNAVWVDVADRSLRVFSKDRWEPTVWKVHIKSPVENDEGVVLTINTNTDMQWSIDIWQ